jgi:hypothetical protein
VIPDARDAALPHLVGQRDSLGLQPGDHFKSTHTGTESATGAASDVSG